MTAEDRDARDRADSAILPPLLCNAQLHWNGIGIVCRHGRLPQDAASEARALWKTPWSLATDGHAALPITLPPLYLLPSPPPPAIEYDKAATCLTFYLTPSLLLATPYPMCLEVTGTLVWVRREGPGEGIPPAVHPMLCVQSASDTSQMERVELVLHVPSHDPLHHHSVLVLQATSEADGVASRLYAESLANALAVHLLKRYAAGGHSRQQWPCGLSPAKLQRITAYIQAHLAHALPVSVLATVAQTSQAHFARLFKQATGQTPHQYVLRCRIAHAKQLLAETDMPLSEIGLQVGCTDQSYFTALFRKYVGTTPKAYRSAIGGM